MLSILQKNCRIKKKIINKQASEKQKEQKVIPHRNNITDTKKESSGFSLNSLSKISSFVEENEKKHENKQINESLLPLSEEYIPVEKEKFLIAWDDYLENEIVPKLKNLAIVLKSDPPQILEDGSVRFIFENTSLLDMFQKERIKLVDFLSEKYNITGIKFNLEIKEDKNRDKGVYLTSAKEIFEYFASKNPVIVDLQKRLDLRPE